MNIRHFNEKGEVFNPHGQKLLEAHPVYYVLKGVSYKVINKEVSPCIIASSPQVQKETQSR